MSGGGSDASAALRQQQVESQARIQAGLKDINAIFGGGTVSDYSPVTAFKPGGEYFTRGPVDATGAYTYKPWKGKSNVSDVGLGAKVTTPLWSKTDNTYKGFDDNFYKQRAQDYVNFAMPQLNQQYKQNSDQLAYTMANRGLLDSSAASRTKQSLDLVNAQAAQGIADQGTSQANTLRSNVEGQRQSLITQLEASADPAAATSQALASSTNFAAPSTFAPLGSMFSNWANLYLANQAGQAPGGTTAGNNPYQFGYGLGGSMPSPVGNTGRITQ